MTRGVVDTEAMLSARGVYRSHKNDGTVLTLVSQGASSTADFGRTTGACVYAMFDCYRLTGRLSVDQFHLVLNLGFPPGRCRFTYQEVQTAAMLLVTCADTHCVANTTPVEFMTANKWPTTFETTYA